MRFEALHFGGTLAQKYLTYNICLFFLFFYHFADHSADAKHVQSDASLVLESKHPG